MSSPLMKNKANLKKILSRDSVGFITFFIAMCSPLQQTASVVYTSITTNNITN